MGHGRTTQRCRPSPLLLASLLLCISPGTVPLLPGTTFLALAAQGTEQQAEAPETDGCCSDPPEPAFSVLEWGHLHPSCGRLQPGAGRGNG